MFQKAGPSDRYLCCARCALLACVLPAVQNCYGCYSQGGLGSRHKYKLTSSVLARLYERVCVCVCVLDHVQESSACVCPYQLYPYFTLYCFYCSQYKVDALTIKKTTFQLLSCYLKSDFTHKMPKMPLKIVIPPFHQCIPYVTVFAFKE